MVPVSGLVALAVLGIAAFLSSVCAPGCSWGVVCSTVGVVELKIPGSIMNLIQSIIPGMDLDW